ncbi:MAG: DUF5615 family PIN-like protein [Candidatus Tectomicrobia bacterium]|nr:DUF5615 family PIN-like protein [Candidatus Tectomicrobia bacterium]
MASAEQEVYFDEDVPSLLADQLRDLGLIVHIPQEVGTVSADDPVHLRVSTRQGWAIVTQNRRDFRRLHWLWTTFHQWGVLPQPHSGILTVYEQDPVLPQEWAPAIHQLLQRQTNLSGTMHMWRHSSRRWEIQPAIFM